MKNKPNPNILLQPLTSIGVKPAICEALEKNGIAIVWDLVQATEEQLLALPGFGKKRVEEILDALETSGFTQISPSAERVAYAAAEWRKAAATAQVLRKSLIKLQDGYNRLEGIHTVTCNHLNDLQTILKHLTNNL